VVDDLIHRRDGDRLRRGVARLSRALSSFTFRSGLNSFSSRDCIFGNLFTSDRERFHCTYSFLPMQLPLLAIYIATTSWNHRQLGVSEDCPVGRELRENLTEDLESHRDLANGHGASHRFAPPESERIARGNESLRQHFGMEPGLLLVGWWDGVCGSNWPTFLSGRSENFDSCTTDVLQQPLSREAANE
jgi:hypothetical protein